MPNDTTARPTTPDAAPPAPAPYIWCSDCRAPMRAHYYALDTRPVCAKCRTQYTERIARGSGPGSFRRALMYGLGAALAGALLIAILVATVRVGRIVCAIGIGWMVATAINKATGDWYDRRFQIMAAVLTYFAVGLGSLAPVLVELGRVDTAAVAAATAEQQAEAAADSARLAAIEDDGWSSDEEAEGPAASAEDDEAEQYEKALADSRRGSKSFEAQAAEGVAAKGALAAVPSLVIMLFTLPLLSLFAFGIYGAVVGLMALGYGMYKAWDMTGGGVAYTVTGPFRVGTGPIPTSF